MIFLDEINAEGDEYKRQSRKQALFRLEAVSTGAEQWVREYERHAAKHRRGRGEGATVVADSVTATSASGSGGEECDCSECAEEEAREARERERGCGRR